MSLSSRGTENWLGIQKRLVQAKVELEYTDTPDIHDVTITIDDLEKAYQELDEFLYRPTTHRSDRDNKKSYAGGHGVAESPGWNVASLFRTAPQLIGCGNGALDYLRLRVVRKAIIQVLLSLTIESLYLYPSLTITDFRISKITSDLYSDDGNAQYYRLWVPEPEPYDEEVYRGIHGSASIMAMNGTSSELPRKSTEVEGTKYSRISKFKRNGNGANRPKRPGKEPRG
ncbi:guanylate kinase [Parahypoxylon ruwenzoriense]